MPILTHLQLRSFRNLSGVDIKPSPHFNIFYGENGAGKTSLLESIYYLGLGRSFRTSNIRKMIQDEGESFSIFAELLSQSQSIPIGVERRWQGDRVLKCNGEKVSSLSSIARYLPIQFLSTMSYKFFLFGPKIRRQFLDWMLFHVEQNFYETWQAFQRVLKQRNAGLKTKLPFQQIETWNNEFISLANEIDRLRLKVITLFEPIFLKILSQLLPNYEIKLTYLRGWKQNEALETLLKSNLQRDYQFGYTQHGPQRADLNFLIEKTPAQDILSQGQQKLALYSFHLAQGLLLKQEKDLSPIYLIDDLPSELDQNKRNCIVNVLEGLNSQVFITGIDSLDLQNIIKLENSKTFHVERGCICQYGTVAI